VCGYNRRHTNVSLGRAHGGGGNSKDPPDSLTGETELCDDLLVGESRKKSVRPGVDADFVTGHVLLNQNGWSLNYTGADNEKGSLDILLVEVAEQFSTDVPSQATEIDRLTNNVPGVRTRTVIETDTPGVFGWAGGDVGESGVSTTGPPSVVSSRSKVCWTAGASTISLGDVRDVDTVKLLHPSRHLVGEEGWEGFRVNKLPRVQQMRSPYMGLRRYLGRAILPS